MIPKSILDKLWFFVFCVYYAIKTFIHTRILCYMSALILRLRRIPYLISYKSVPCTTSIQVHLVHKLIVLYSQIAVVCTCVVTLLSAKRILYFLHHKQISMYVVGCTLNVLVHDNEATGIWRKPSGNCGSINLAELLNSRIYGTFFFIFTSCALIMGRCLSFHDIRTIWTDDLRSLSRVYVTVLVGNLLFFCSNKQQRMCRMFISVIVIAMYIIVVVALTLSAYSVISSIFASESGRWWNSSFAGVCLRCSIAGRHARLAQCQKCMYVCAGYIDNIQTTLKSNWEAFFYSTRSSFRFSFNKFVL